MTNPDTVLAYSAEATEGPWKVGDGWVYSRPVYADDHRLRNVLGLDYSDPEAQMRERKRVEGNVAFIANARTDLPVLAQAVKAVLAIHKEGECGTREGCGEYQAHPCPTRWAVMEAGVEVET